MKFGNDLLTIPASCLEVFLAGGPDRIGGIDGLRERGYGMGEEAGVGGGSGPPDLSLTGRKETAEAATSLRNSAANDSWHHQRDDNILNRRLVVPWIALMWLDASASYRTVVGSISITGQLSDDLTCSPRHRARYPEGHHLTRTESTAATTYWASMEDRSPEISRRV
ncbi:hypothetical protein EVAR_95480_1 [Eumeta japonica]|uniref:Uncharacterized protein n=1 Tax=Eumeta variegata TaxID=151549 RepID=A0A4C1UJ07_EUMVA|nr:hypothetical protein EVAR_95480_1 [Eumeta japonica]